MKIAEYIIKLKMEKLPSTIADNKLEDIAYLLNDYLNFKKIDGEYFLEKDGKLVPAFDVAENKKDTLYNILQILKISTTKGRVSTACGKLTKNFIYLKPSQTEKIRTIMMESAPVEKFAPPNFIKLKNNQILDLANFEKKNGKKIYSVIDARLTDYNFMSENKISFASPTEQTKKTQDAVTEYLNQLSDGDETTKHNILCAAALCFVRHNANNRIVNLYGEGGCGKTTFISLVQRMLGEQNYATLTPIDLSINRFASFHLLGKTANFVDDYKITTVKEDTTARLKSLAGEGSISAEIKHGPIFSFRSQAQNIFLSNKKMEFENEDYAILRRMVPIELRHNFTKSGKKQNHHYATRATNEFLNLLFFEIIQKLDADGLVEFKLSDEHFEVKPKIELGF